MIYQFLTVFKTLLVEHIGQMGFISRWPSKGAVQEPSSAAT
jgi:hypothetical protein